MKVIDVLKGDISHVTVNLVTKRNIGYSDKETAEYEITFDKIIWGDSAVSLVEFEDIRFPEVVSETDICGGYLKVDNREMIRTNGQAYKK